MKVVLLAPLPPPIGGIAGWTKRMVDAKLKNNWQVIVVDEKVIGGREVFGKKGKKRLFTEIKRCFLIWRNLILTLRDAEVSVVHSCIPSATLSMIREYICAIITKLKRRKFIIHFRCTVPNTTRGYLGMLLLKKLCKISDCVVVLNNQSREFLLKETKAKIKLIPNFVTCQEIAAHKSIHDKIKKVVYVGGVIKEKGCADIIAVAKLLPKIDFELIGIPDDEIIGLAKNVPNVKLVGALDRLEVMHKMQSADVFMFLSRYLGEGFSNALLEAMALGLPCIVSDWAANKDMIEDKGGFVVPLNASHEILEAFKIMHDKEVRYEQSVFNINKVRKNYSDKIVLDMYVDLYEELTGAKRNE